MFPIKTYLDIADDTYVRGLPLEERRRWGRLEIRDGNKLANAIEGSAEKE